MTSAALKFVSATKLP